jgi:hypothetical protein
MESLQKFARDLQANEKCGRPFMYGHTLLDEILYMQLPRTHEVEADHYHHHNHNCDRGKHCFHADHDHSQEPSRDERATGQAEGGLEDAAVGPACHPGQQDRREAGVSIPKPMETANPPHSSSPKPHSPEPHSSETHNTQGSETLTRKRRSTASPPCVTADASEPPPHSAKCR